MAPLHRDECTLIRDVASKALIGQVRPQDYEEVGELDLSSSSRTMPPPPYSGSLHKQHETNNNTPPDHWPVSSTSDDYQPHHRQAAFPFDVLNAKHKKEAAKPLFFYSINTMLPQQNEECWDNNDTNDDSDALDDILDQALKTHPGNNGNPESSTAKMKSILRRPSKNNNSITSTTSITIQNNKPRKRTVEFSQDSIVIHIIPSTSNIDMSTLYYTDEEIRTFKKEYKQEKKSEKIRAYSYLKYKMLNRLYGSSSSSNSSRNSRRNSDTSTTCINGDDDLDCTNIEWSCMSSHDDDEKDISVTSLQPPACITISSSDEMPSNIAP